MIPFQTSNLSSGHHRNLQGVAQFGLERSVRNREAGGSNPLTLTMKFITRINGKPLIIWDYIVGIGFLLVILWFVIFHVRIV